MLVSTDKAVNPKNVMGQSKALCEWIVESLGHRADVPTRFVAVRFGNVLGSSGQRDPDLPPSDRARRPGHGDAPGDDPLLHDDPGGGLARSCRRARSAAAAQVFVLDMGEPVAILDLAREHDPALRPRAEPGHRRSSSSARARARSCTRSCGATGETVKPTTHAKISRATRPAIDAAWLADELACSSTSSRRATRSRSSRSSARSCGAAPGGRRGSGRHVALTAQFAGRSRSLRWLW